MAVKSTQKTNRPNMSNRSIRGSGSRNKTVPMARQKNIPAGKYRSKIVKVSFKKTRAGEDAVEIIYELTAPDGSVRKMREVIPYDSWAFEIFCDTLIAAGLEDGDDISAAVGVTEDVLLEYPDTHGLGHFTKRTPSTAQSAPSTSMNVDDDEDVPVSNRVDDEEEDDDDFLDFELD